MSFVDSSHGWAVGGSTILATSDGGATWSAQTSGTTNTLFGVSFVDPSHGWAVGDVGTILAFTVPAVPSVSITTPANGATYSLGQVVSSSFSCTEGAGGPGIQSCVDQSGNPSGAQVDTSTAGQHTFTVTATSKDSLSSQSSVTYTVSPSTVPPTGCQDPAGAYNQGFNAGFNSGFNTGFNSGFNHGFNSGFQSGFSDGFRSTARHAAARFSSLASAQAVAAQATYPACNPQFNQGFNTAFNSGFNSGFQKGFNPGFNSGFNPGFKAGFRASHHPRRRHHH